jgi:hypothetical protein
MTRHKVAHADTIPLVRLWGAAALRMSLLQLENFATTLSSSSSCRGTTSDHPTGAACLTMTETLSSSHNRFHITALTTACLPMAMATGVLPGTEQRCHSTAAEQQLSCHSIHISRVQVMTVDDGCVKDSSQIAQVAKQTHTVLSTGPTPC